MTKREQPLVSILINSYNYDRFIAEAIDSALAQTYPHVEVIVVDDGSSDRSPEIIADYGDRITAIYQSNQGQAAAFNRGFEISQGDIICFLDADDIFHSQKAEILAKAWQECPEAQWYLHPLTLFNQENQATVVRHKAIAIEISQLRDVRKALEAGKLGDPFDFPIPPTSGMCFTNQLAQKLLPMPLSGGIILNDSYLKFAALGISSGVAIDFPLAYQRIHDRNLFTTSKGNPDISLKRQQTNTAIFLNTAYWLKAKFPTLTKFADSLFAVGVAMNWQLKARSKGKNKALLQNKQIIQNYYRSSSPSSVVSIILKSCYKYLRQR